MIDPDTAALLDQSVTLVLCTRDRTDLASAAYCHGVRIDAPRRRITVIVEAARFGPVIENLRSTRDAALLVTRPQTLQGRQLKGTDAQIGSIEPGDLERVARYVAQLGVALEEVGDPPDWTAAALGYDPAALVTVSFTPGVIFNSTPGPQAGRRL